jgi:putative spermidine/putrescine transport system substrate-binding protein
MTATISRRGFLQILALGAGASLVAACSPSQGAAPTTQPAQQAPAQPSGGGGEINVTTYGGSWKDHLVQYVAQPFEQQYKTKVNLSEGISTEWVAKIKATGSGNPPYDVLICNEPPLYELRKAGVFDKRDTSLAPNIKNLYDQALRGDDSLILMWGAVGLGYRDDLVTTKVDSWEAPFDPAFADKRGTYTLANTLGLQMFLMYNKMFGKDEYDADAGFSALKKWVPMKLADFTGTMETYITQGEVTIANLPDASVAKLAKQGLKLSFGAPKEGLPALEQVAQVLKGSKNREMAWKFLDTFMDAPAQVGFATTEFYGPGNKTVKLSAEDARNITATPEQVKQLVFFDWEKIGAQRGRWVERWNRELAS